MLQKSFILCVLLASLGIQAQSDSVPEIDTTKYVEFFKVQKLDEIEELDFKEEKEFTLKEKKPKRKVYYGKKTKKGFTKSGIGQSQVIEIFHYLKKWEEPNPYIKDIYWLDARKLQIVKSKKYDPQYSKILHGPYKKMVNDVLVEEGIYYVGTKHGRWVEHSKPKDFKFRSGDRNKKGRDEYGDKIIIEGSDTVLTYQLLESKEKYNRGWPKYAQLTYYDAQKEKLKEVLPYDRDKKLNGDYYSYFENGKIESRGALINGQKAGNWIEYQVVRGRVKPLKEVEYPEYPGSTPSEGHVTALWDHEGKVVFDEKRRIDLRPTDDEDQEDPD